MNLSQLKTAMRLSNEFIDLGQVARDKIGQIQMKAADPEIADLKEKAGELGEALRDTGLYRPAKRK